MAGTTVRRRGGLGLSESVVRQLVIEHNKLVDDLEALRAKYAAALAKLDADGGVTDTNYVSTQTVLAATLTAAKIGDDAGTAYTA